MRPNTKVSTTKKTITPMFNASTAGRNCIFASHPSQMCSVPVKSRNSPVMRTNTTRAQVNLIFRNIIVNLENSKFYQDLVFIAKQTNSSQVGHHHFFRLCITNSYGILSTKSLSNNDLESFCENSLI